MRFGQWKTNSILREKIDRNAKYIWFHASSLGEFEQGRPMIEKIKAEHPEYKVLLTFFSPSGYEVRKNYKGADVICYLCGPVKKHLLEGGTFICSGIIKEREDDVQHALAAAGYTVCHRLAKGEWVCLAAKLA